MFDRKTISNIVLALLACLLLGTVDLSRGDAVGRVLPQLPVVDMGSDGERELRPEALHALFYFIEARTVSAPVALERQADFDRSRLAGNLSPAAVASSFVPGTANPGLVPGDRAGSPTPLYQLRAVYRL